LPVNPKDKYQQMPDTSMHAMLNMVDEKRMYKLYWAKVKTTATAEL